MFIGNPEVQLSQRSGMLSVMLPACDYVAVINTRTIMTTFDLLRLPVSEEVMVGYMIPVNES